MKFSLGKLGIYCNQISNKVWNKATRYKWNQQGSFQNELYSWQDSSNIKADIEPIRKMLA